ncbi:MAG: hypothetical protein AB8G99_04305 [Planctomycetaceae bacterium]
MEPRRNRSLAQVLYNHNPFYLISTCCALFAIQRVFRPLEVNYIDPWMLMAAMSGLTILMAATAWVVVRYGRVWEDARSLMLILVIMFLAMSVSFDEVLNIRGQEALWLPAAGFLLSFLITETIVRLLKIPLHGLFRLPFYLMLALFFGYPVLVSPEVTSVTISVTRWRIAAFPLLSGICTLLLLPAVWRGRKLVDETGSPCPWKWPLLPWTLFGFLGIAVCARSYSLSISFDPSWGWADEMFTSFGAYALNPFILCASLVVLEIALTDGTRRLQNGVLIASTLLMLLCSFPRLSPDPTYRSFLLQFVESIGSPIFLTLFGVFLLGGYAWMRGVRSGEYVVLVALAGLSVVGDRTLGVQSITEPHIVPLGMIVALLLITGLARRDAFRCFLGATAVSAALALLMWNQDMLFFRRIVPGHFLLFSTIAIGSCFEGRIARFLEISGAVLVPVVASVTARSFVEMDVSPVLPLVYFLTMNLSAIALGELTSSTEHTLMGCLGLVAGAIRLVIAASSWLLQLFGIEIVATVGFGIVFFAIGAWISAHKARLHRGDS